MIIFILTLTYLSQTRGNYCYDHQNDIYTAHEQFRGKNCSLKCSVMPFLSPDNSLEAHMAMIEEAQESIIIANPTFESWQSKCTHNHNQCAKHSCTGCELSYYPHNESFPLFAALLNAIHLRKVTVRILTNNYSVPTCTGKATLLDWLSLNKVSVRMYKTTSFLHAKFMMIDNGRKTLVSSVNYSKTSFMKNRESGVIISQCDDCEVLKLYKTVFEYDWQNADQYTLDNHYTDDEIKYITDPQYLANVVVTPPSQRVPNITTTDLTIFPGVALSGYVAPDYARETFFEALNKIRSSLSVHIYTISDLNICNQLVKLKNSSINVTLLVSKRVAGIEKNHKVCYNKLTAKGITVKSAYRGFSYSHQKYWIVDDRTVHLSTGNWAGTDFAMGDEWTPRNHVNRDMIVVMENPALVQFFSNVFQHDFAMGEDW